MTAKVALVRLCIIRLHLSVLLPSASQFKELHTLFQQLYEHSDGVYDELAERVRTLGGCCVLTYVAGTLS